MALTEETIQDKIEIVGDYKIIQVRTATIIKKNGKEINRSYHRHIIAPDINADSLANESAEVKAIANAAWTDDIKTKYKEFVKAQEI